MKDLFNKFNMQESKGMKTPMTTSGHLDLIKDGNPIGQKVYRSMMVHCFIYVPPVLILC